MEPVDDEVTVTVNGHSITAAREKITCRFGTDESPGEYVEAEITVQSYELICKNTDEKFCDCDYDDRLGIKQVEAIE